MNSSKKVNGIYYDGSSTKEETVSICFYGDKLELVSVRTEEKDIFNSDEYELVFPVGKNAFKIKLPDRRQVVFDFDPELNKYLLKNNSSIISKFISIVESKFKYILLLFISAFIALTITYIYGLPILVDVTKPFLPRSFKVVAGENAIKILDKAIFDKSKIGSKRKSEITNSFNSLLKKIDYPEKVNLYFKKSKALGANAIAILPNNIILTDDLVKLLNNEEIIGVLAHELAHLSYDHGSEVILRQAYISVVSLFVIGGDPGSLHALSMAILEASYSRDQERESDILATKYLKKSGKNPRILATALEKLHSQYDVKIGDKTFEKLESYMSSHPGVKERIKYIDEHSS